MWFLKIAMTALVFTGHAKPRSASEVYLLEMHARTACEMALAHTDINDLLDVVHHRDDAAARRKPRAPKRYVLRAELSCVQSVDPLDRSINGRNTIGRPA